MKDQHYRSSEDKAWCYFHPKEAVIGVCPLCLNERLLVLASKQGGGRHLHYQTRIITRATTSFINLRRTTSTTNNNTNKGFGNKNASVTTATTANHHHHHHKRLIPKIFALGSLLHRLDLRTGKPLEDYDTDDDDAFTSHEDSFISIKFEKNGVGSWEKDQISLKHCAVSSSWSHSSTKESNNKEEEEEEEGEGEQANNSNNKGVIEHARPRPSLRWQKRIGHLFQLVRWKRAHKGGGVCHGGGGGGGGGNNKQMDGVKVRNGWIRTLTKRRTQG